MLPSFGSARSALLATLLLISALLTGCATDQAVPVASAASTRGPIPRGQSGITITRLDGFYGRFIAAKVAANGAEIASLEKGGTYSGSIPSGPVTLTVSSAGDLTHYTLHFNAQAGRRYAFEISPRNEQYAAAVMGGLVGYVADSAINGEQAGTFKIVEVTRGR